MSRFNDVTQIIVGLSLTFLALSAHAGMPMWSFEPLTATTLSVPVNSTAIVQYNVTNNSKKSHTLAMKAIPAVTQITTGVGICRNPFTLGSNSSCVLSLQINGSELNKPITDGPIVCQQGSSIQCYRPSQANILRLTQTSADSTANIAVSGSPLTLLANGSSGNLSIINNSSTVTASNITSNFTGTALDGNVNESGNTCASVSPGATCVITYIPGSTLVPPTNFTIQGSNTNSITASITIESGSSLSVVSPNTGTTSGGVGVTLTGTGLAGTTSVTFGGTAATSVNVITSTTVTAVTPAHAAGVVDVSISTPAGGATLSNAFTYQTTAIGQSAHGGTIACLNGGLQNLIASSADNSTIIAWGGSGTTTNAQSDTDGAANAALIVSTLGGNGGVPYAAQLCDNYEVDSQGNTPCESGNTCYNDWFLAAKNQLNCLYTNRVAIGGFSTDNYWTSTESTATPAFSALTQLFLNGSQPTLGKGFSISVRCVRSFTP